MIQGFDGLQQVCILIHSSWVLYGGQQPHNALHCPANFSQTIFVFSSKIFEEFRETLLVAWVRKTSWGGITVKEKKTIQNKDQFIFTS